MVLRTRGLLRLHWCLVLGAVACDGADGKNGSAGIDGASGTDGTNGVDGTDGTNGADGTNGVDGQDAVTLDQDGDGVPILEDCDDSDPSVSEMVLLQMDFDGDGYGSSHVAQEFCAIPPGWVDNSLDCDDLNDEINPDATEVCNDGVDDDCDGLVDDDDDSLDSTSLNAFYLDDDGDGFGSTEVAFCSLSSGLSDVAGDCDDGNPDVNPDAVEVCGDGIDDNCNGLADGCTFDPESSVDDANVLLEGEDAGDAFGAAVAVVDVDADGIDDLLVGASGTDDGGTGSGSVYVFLGTASVATDWSVSSAVRLDGATSGAEVGLAVSNLGDLDGDGIDDVGIGSAGDDQAYVMYGGTSAWGSSDSLSAVAVTLSSDAPSGRFGRELVSASDVDGDGFDDLLISDEGDTRDKGIVYLVLGNTTAWTGGVLVPDVAAAEITTDTSGSGFGELRSMSGGDLDGDGLGDVVLGEPGHDGAGANYGQAYAFFGASSPSGTVKVDDADTVFVTTSATSNPYLGVSTAITGDVDGDGHADLGLGAWAFDSSGVQNVGAVYLYLGSSSAWASELDLADAATRVDGVSYQGLAGSMVSTSIDIDSDGIDDLVVGSSGYRNSVKSGGMFAFFGQPGLATGSWSLTDADLTIDGSVGDLGLGKSLQVGDFDDDGFTDLVVGGAGHSSDQGGAFVFIGAGY